MVKEIWNTLSPFRLPLKDRCVLAIFVLLILLIVGILGLSAFWLVDVVGINQANMAVTTVEIKQIVPAYTIVSPVGKILVPVYHSEVYLLHFKIDEEEISFAVYEKLFNDIKVGDRIEVDYGFGRLSNQHFPAKIRLVDR